jgi:dihydrodipicolinate synthase/N-acetylneuraminate lyase
MPAPIPMNRATVAGVYAAVATPVGSDGRADIRAFDRLIDFLLASGLDGICVGGATGEYPHFEVSERQALVRRAAARLPPDRVLLVGIGGAPAGRVVELGRAAVDCGARALLLPMPFFFRYEQHDLDAFSRHVAAAIRAPCLLYDLPHFTNPIDTATAITLLRTAPHIIGIKDSSGRPARLLELVGARGDAPWSLLVGDDALLARGLELGWNGGISGIASFCPELIVSLYRSVVARNRDEADRWSALLTELLDHVSALPAPWGIRVGLRVRGFDTGALPMPLSADRRQQIARFEEWLAGWLPRAGLPNM